jgi:succinate dehydrogenase / fumarate reductase cytochrome b subunit
MYRGREGMWSWILHRVTGVGILLFLAVHIVDIYLLGWPDLFNRLLFFYRHPVFRVAEVFLVAAALYHALNGIRIMLVDFWVEGTRRHRQIFWAQMVIFLLIWIPASFLMLSPVVFGR